METSNQKMSLNILSNRDILMHSAIANRGVFMKYALSFLLLFSISSPAFAAKYIEWLSIGQCWQVTPSGQPIEQVYAFNCRQVIGTQYRWMENGSCGEFTPERYFIEQVTRGHCEAESNVVRKRSNRLNFP